MAKQRLTDKQKKFKADWEATGVILELRGHFRVLDEKKKFSAAHKGESMWLDTSQTS